MLNVQQTDGCYPLLIFDCPVNSLMIPIEKSALEPHGGGPLHCDASDAAEAGPMCARTPELMWQSGVGQWGGTCTRAPFKGPRAMSGEHRTKRNDLPLCPRCKAGRWLMSLPLRPWGMSG